MANKKKINDAYEACGDLMEFLQDRIEEYHQVKGKQADRHAMILYRDKAWLIRDVLREMVDED